MANRNRDAGHNAERLFVNELKELGFDVVTSRSESMSMDNRKVDIFSPLGVDNPLMYYIQVKCTVNKPNYHELLNEMPQDRTPLVLHRQKRKQNGRFLTDGDYIILKKDDFYKLLKP